MFFEFVEKIFDNKKSKARKKTKNVFTLDDFLLIPRISLKFASLNLNKSDLRPHWTFYIATINIVMNICASLGLIIKKSIIGIGYVDIILSLGYCSVMILSLVKSCVLVSQTENLKRFLDELSELFPKTVDDQKKFDIKSHLERNTIVNISWFLFVSCIGVAFIILGVLQVGSAYVNGICWRFDLMYQQLYPFDPYHHGIFECVYIAQQISTYSTIIDITAVDSLLFSLISNACIQFEQLSNDFANANILESMTEKETIANHVEKHKKLMM